MKICVIYILVTHAEMNFEVRDPNVSTNCEVLKSAGVILRTPNANNGSKQNHYHN